MMRLTPTTLYSKLTFFAILAFLLSGSLSAQVQVSSNIHSWGMMADGNFGMCHFISVRNTGDVAVCSPQINVDLSAYPSVLDVISFDLSGAGFDFSDYDSSPSGFSSTNLSGNVIDPSTTKCIGPNEVVFFRFTTYSDPGLWGDGTVYNWSVTAEAVHPTLGQQTGLRTNNTEQIYLSDIILGAALQLYGNGTPLISNQVITPNLDGTYDISFRSTIGNYENFANNGGPVNNTTYVGDLSVIYDIMPINLISVSSADAGLIIPNSSYNGGASEIAGTPVVPDDILITGGTLVSAEEDFVTVSMNVGPIDLPDRRLKRFTSGRVSGLDGFGNTIETATTEGTDPTRGQALGPAVACGNGFVFQFGYTADFDLVLDVINETTAASGTAGNLDITYEAVVTADRANNVNIFRLSAINDLATSFGSDFVGIVTAPTVINIDATSPPSANTVFDGSSGSGHGSGIDLLSGNATNLLEPGQSFRIRYTVEVQNTSAPNTYQNTLNAIGDNTSNELIVNETATDSHATTANPGISISNASAIEGNALTFTITATSPVPNDITFDLSYMDISTFGADYSRPLQIILPANSSIINFQINAANDGFDESNETFEITLSESSGSVNFIDATALGTIYDNTISDLDNDGIGDATDLDDDNDGILDTIEGCENTDIATTIGFGNDVPNTTYTLAGTSVTYTVSSSNPSDVIIQGYDAGLTGNSILLLGTAGNTASIVSTYATPLSHLFFKLTDFDNETRATINVYDENNILYDLTSEGIVSVGSIITQSNNTFEATAGESDGDIPANDGIGSILLYFEKAVSRIEIAMEFPVNSSIRFTQPDYCIADFDGDGITDHRDLDSDADGIPDNIEAQTTQGYITPSGTVDADGVDTAYPIGINPTNSDSTDNPDYLDTDSDNEGANDTAEANITLTGNDSDNDGLDDATDTTADYSDVGGTIDNPLAAPIILPDLDADAASGGDVDFRDAIDDRVDTDNDGILDTDDLDDDNDGILDTDEDLNVDGDNDATTNPTDSDDDGVANHLDLDSDNDGILDVTEAGHDQSHTNGEIDGLPADFGANGLFNGLETDDTLTASVTYAVAESADDADTIPNFLDLDSDGDAIPDNVEAQLSTNYIAVNDNNSPTFTNNRGVDIAYLGGLTPVNTDGTDNPDYLDTDSDNEGGSDTIEAGLTLTGNDSDGDGLDDVTDISIDYSEPGGIIRSPISGGIRLPDTDNDATSGGDVDFRDANDDRLDTDGDGIGDVVDLDDDNDGIPDAIECSLSPFRFGPVDSSDVTFDITGTGGSDEGVLNSIRIIGVGNLLDNFVKPIDYSSNFNSIDPDDIHEQYHAMRLSDITSPSWNTDIRLAFQSQDLNHYQALDNTILSTDTWTLTYDAVQVTTEGFLVLMERAGNNPYAINVYDMGGNLINSTRYIVETSAYIDTPVNASNGQIIKLAIIPMTDFAPIGTLVGSIEFFAHNATGNGPDGKAFITTDGDICDDSDGDGVINSLDLDSDNDGIYDIVEGGVLAETGTDDTDADGRLDGNAAQFGNNGLLNAIENDDSLSATITYNLSESTSDADTIPDFIDLDSDGDGIPDIVEAQLTISYSAPTETVDANGVDIAFATGLTPENTDGTDLPDYLDNDSDNEGANDTTEAGITLSGVDADNDGLDDAMDDNVVSYADPGGNIDDPLTAPLQLLDSDTDATTGGDVDFRDAIDDRPDTDNDGIVDALDFDDDNDGILDTDEGCGNFIINGSFEHDDFTDVTAFPNGFTGPNGTFIGNTYNTNVLSSWNYTQNLDGWLEGGTHSLGSFADAYHGRQFVDVIGNNRVTGGISNQLSQAVILDEGESYTFSFYWGEDVGHERGDLIIVDFEIVDANGAIVAAETHSAAAQGSVDGTVGPRSWYYVERTFTATTDAVTVRFTSTPPSGNPAAGATLDFVRLLSNGNCLDTDNDGVPDALDLDSDNDGIYDAVEAGHGANHTNGILNGGVGADGIPDVVQDNPDREAVNYILFDSDADGIDDFQVLDADADNCFDVVEAGFADNDSDGYLGASPTTVDANGLVVAGSDGYSVPLDSDSNTIPDYREAGIFPIITLQPLDAEICSGQPISFSASATGADRLEWQLFDGGVWTDISDGGIYGGSDTDTLQISNVTISENGNRYRAVVVNSAFICGEIITDEAVLTVQETPDVRIGDGSITEGGTLIFPVTLSSAGCLAQNVTLTFTFTDGTADTSDYTNSDVQVTIPAGILVAEVAVQTIDDDIDEGNETFMISVASIDSGTVNDTSDTATGTILDNDSTELDSDNDGILDSVEDLNADGDNNPATDPTNSDGDPYPDYLDIDSDDDGIPDNVESQTTDGYIAPSLQDVNANGLDDAYENGVSIGITPIDTDDDNLPDYVDVDSDNDNVPDTIEGHDQNHDGVADIRFIGSDKDNDGLDDGYEGNIQIDADVNDEIDDPDNDLPNTDNDASLDYRDADDDNDGVPTRDEDGNSDRNYANDDIDNDGTPDYLEPNLPEVEVFNVVTPNGDRVHDYLIITGLDVRPNNTIKIFNRWGVLVYETRSYDSTGNRFNGTSQARATIDKEERLPTGTYFYILNYEDTEGGFKTLSGHLYLN